MSNKRSSSNTLQINLSKKMKLEQLIQKITDREKMKNMSQPEFQSFVDRKSKQNVSEQNFRKILKELVIIRYQIRHNKI